MTENSKRYIEQNIELIMSGEFVKFYTPDFDRGDVTMTLLAAEINPLEHMTYIPEDFLANTNIETFEVPDNITSIHREAFFSCKQLKSVKLPEGITYIGDNAFSESNLEQINLPSNLIHLESDAFAQTNLETVIIPDQVLDVPPFCFEDCLKLKHVELGKSIISVGVRAFADCLNLETVILNEGLSDISARAFIGCKSLKSIYIPESVAYIDDTAFFHTNVVIHCVGGSEAYRFAKENGLKYKLVP